MKNKIIVFSSLAITALIFASPVFAASADVTSVETFIKSVIQVLVAVAGLVAAGFFVWGGVAYITSSGNPESLDRAKKTIVYAAIGLAVVLGAFVLTNIVSDLATGAFGTLP
jgi:TRAP-type C4-dicarboxylate transport system permease small subunit